MDINEAAHIDAAAHSDAIDGDPGARDRGAVARRRLLVAGVSGTAISLLPFLAGRAGAAGRNNAASATSTTVPASGSTATTAAATTTTAPPKRPTADDTVLLDFALQVELTVRNLYDLALNGKVYDGATQENVKAIREDHEAYAQSLSGLLGRPATFGQVDALFTELKADFTGSAADVTAAARTLENNLVATHNVLIGELLGTDGATLIASMLVVEARHATVLAAIGGVTDLAEQLASDGTALSPSDYPAK